ncbi:MAG: hypothetical protein R3F55_19690 [Alphaproteobacteria bacterium]
MSALETYRRIGSDRIASGDIAGALAPLRIARRLAPTDAAVGQVLGQLLFVLGEQERGAGRLESARNYFAEGVGHAPDDAALWNGLGQCCVAVGDVAEGVECYRRARRLRPDAAIIHSNLGNALVRLNRDEAADEAYARASLLLPDDPEIRHNRALHMLRRGRLAEGWDEYRARLLRPGCRPPLDGPEWDGGDPAGRTIAVWSEQGIGDELMFGTCVPDLAAQAGHVVWECAPKLAGLLQRSLPQVSVVARPAAAAEAQTAEERFPWRPQVPAIDGWIGVAGLAAVYRRSIANFPSAAGFACADPKRRADAAAWLAALPQPRVGLCWRGGVVTQTRSLVYAGVTEMARLVRETGITPVLLQYRADDTERAALSGLGIDVHAMPGLDLFDDIEGAAALIAELDLVVAAGTSVAELAGALGVPVWRFGPQSDFTLLGSGSRPWFPSMRVFTKPDAERDWSALFERMASELRLRSAGRP